MKSQKHERYHLESRHDGRWLAVPCEPLNTFEEACKERDRILEGHVRIIRTVVEVVW